MSFAPAVTVAIVSQGRPALLGRLLKALEYQRYRNFELVVVADTAPGARPASPLSPRWVSFAEWNISAARNHAVDAARGEIVAFCDDDAVPEFDWLCELLRPFADPAVAAAGGFVRDRSGVRFQWRAETVDRLGRDAPLALPAGEPVVLAPDADRVPKTVGTNCAFRRAALVGIGGFDPGFRFFLEEADAGFRLMAAGWSIALVPSAEVHHDFAASPTRTSRRVPLHVDRIAESAGLFLAKHASAKERGIGCAAFRDAQRRRFARFHGFGLLGGADIARLANELEVGLARGLSMSAARGTISPPSQPFRPTAAPAAGQRIGVIGDRRRAAELAAEGHEVTLVATEPTPRPTRVVFDAEGFFRHRVGTLNGLRGWPDRGAASRRELDRISARRGPFDRILGG